MTEQHELDHFRRIVKCLAQSSRSNGSIKGVRRSQRQNYALSNPDMVRVVTINEFRVGVLVLSVQQTYFVAASGRDRPNQPPHSHPFEKALRATFEILTPRERQVMVLVTSGLMNKQVAAEMGLREITVKIHRGIIMRKMRAGSLPDLVRMADARRQIRHET